MRFAPIAVLLVVAVLAVGSMWNDSATADEPAHVAAGLLKLREGRVDFYATQAPLAEVVEAAPLAVAGYRVPDAWRRIGNRPWVIGQLLLYRSGYDAHRMLVLARLPVIAMFLALCAAVYLFVLRATRNRVAALAALVLTGFCPTLLAHGRLATVDMALALFAFVATALLLRMLDTPTPALALATGVATACALASKVSGAILLPFFAALVVAHAIAKRGRTPIRALLLAAAAAVAVFAGIYLAVARSLDLTLPFAQYANAIHAVYRFVGDRYVLPQFLLGQFSRDGWPHYYLVALLVKTPLPALAFVLLGIVLAVRHPRFETLACLGFALIFLAVSSTSHLDLGVRHVLPILPFLFAGSAIALFDAASAAPERERRIFVVAAGVLLAWQVATALFAYPSYISYFNPLIGSHRNADNVLIDSNLDWGEDLHRLALWSRAHGVGVMRVHYFGGGSVEYEFGDRAIRWPAPRREVLPRGWFAVSRHFYRLSFDPEVSAVPYDAYLAASHAHFVTSIGGSIDVYRVD